VHFHAETLESNVFPSHAVTKDSFADVMMLGKGYHAHDLF
jgi:hypothetical protein